MKLDLKALRKKIDDVDKRIISLLNERTKYVLKVGNDKIKTGKEIYAPDRETAIYEKINTLHKDGPMPIDAIKSIYREIMSASLSLEKQLQISYLGPEATYTHLASISKFGSSVQYVPADTINEVFSEVEQQRADYGIIPVENSIEGGVTHSLDMFIDTEVKICAEILFPIAHNLMSNSKMKDIKRIYSNPQVFGQCRHWLQLNLPQADLIDTASSAAAARKAAKEDQSAAIGSKLAANLYNLPILEASIQDFAQNVTRFLVIARNVAGATGKDKTSIVVSLKDKVGALHELILPFKKHRVNMTRIESRPSKRKAWDYYFFIDFEGHVSQPKVKKMLKDVEGKVKLLKVLGSYPASSRKEI